MLSLIQASSPKLSDWLVKSTHGCAPLRPERFTARSAQQAVALAIAAVPSWFVLPRNVRVVASQEDLLAWEAGLDGATPFRRFRARVHYDPFSLSIDEIRCCRACGCTDDHACEGGCYWAEADLCSACAPVKRQAKGRRHARA